MSARWCRPSAAPRPCRFAGKRHPDGLHPDHRPAKVNRPVCPGRLAGNQTGGERCRKPTDPALLSIVRSLRSDDKSLLTTACDRPEKPCDLRISAVVSRSIAPELEP